METEYEKAHIALDMFCRAAEKATGDFWGIQQMENGDLAVVRTFKAAKDAMDDPKTPDGRAVTSTVWVPGRYVPVR